MKGTAEKLRRISTQPTLYKWLASYGKYLP